MYFLLKGKMSVVYSAGKKTEIELIEGDYFGEQALLGLTRRIYPVIATTFCETLLLYKEDLDTILKWIFMQKKYLSNNVKCSERDQF